MKEFTYIITDPSGIHARPAGLLVKAAKKFEAGIFVEKDAKKAFPKSKWNKLHLQIIYYAREYSPARGWDLDKDVITKIVTSDK